MSSDFAIRLVVDDARSVATVEVSGDFDAARVEQFDGRVASVPLDQRAVVVDVRATTILDSAAIGALIRVADRCRANGIAHSTHVSRPFQVDLLRITGLDEFLSMVVVPGAPADGRTGRADPFG